jgi:hypothetical protein
LERVESPLLALAIIEKCEFPITNDREAAADIKVPTKRVGLTLADGRYFGRLFRSAWRRVVIRSVMGLARVHED